LSFSRALNHHYDEWQKFIISTESQSEIQSSKILAKKRKLVKRIGSINLIPAIQPFASQLFKSAAPDESAEILDTAAI
jgi:hypothetical protein